MSELTYKNLTELPPHHQNAEKFIAAVLGQVASQFPDLKIEAVNQTAEDLAQFPDLAEAAKLEGYQEMVKEINRGDAENERESAESTRVSVSLIGDQKPLIEQATKIIHQQAKRNRGNNTDDSGIGNYGPREGLPKILGHKPELEDMPLWERFLGYKFS